MVVILLLSPCTCSSRSSISSHIQQQQQQLSHHQPAPETDSALDSITNLQQQQQEHGCSSSSSVNSNVSSSASTGDTAIPASYLRQQQLQYQRQRQQQQYNHTQSGRPSHSHSYYTALPPRASATGPAPPAGATTTTTANAVPKPPRIHATTFAAAPSPRIFRIYTQSLPLPPANYNNTNNNNINTTNTTNTTTTDYVRHVTRVNFYDIDTSQVEFEPKDDEESNEATSTNCDTEAITKEEEWITKRKTELTTTRQIETRVKRQVKLQDGKVIEDSGPIVSTNTTEDTDKQETETTEKRDLGLPDDLNGNAQLIDVAALEAGAVNEQQLAQLQETFGPPSGPVGPAGGPAAGGLGKLVKRMVPRPVDGLVRQVDDKRVISHEEIKDYHETEDVKHLGDFTDETYVNAVRDGVEDLEAALCSPESQRALVPLGPKVIANRSKSRKTIDSEDTQKRCLAQEDGTLVTESKQTTEHELIVDDELPEEEADKGNALLGEQVTTTASNQRYFKQRDEQHVDVVANGKLVSTEMRYAAETTQMEKDGGDLERPGDWDSLSARMRKLRRSQQQQQKEVALLADRKDALTKRPLDFDREEETRKGETMKWLESHFGSESTASNDSRDDVDAEADVEPTKKSYFNVTIKSQSQPNYVSANQQQPHHHHHHHPQTLPRSAERERDRERERERVTPLTTAATLERKAPSSGGAAGAGTPAGRSKYFQGISNWSDRKEIGASTANHFSSQAFREDLQETVRRNGLKNSNKNTKPSGGPGSSGSIKPVGGSVNNNHEVLAKDSYVSREDILQQKRQSLSSQFLARSMRGSRDALDDLEAIPGPGPGPNQLRSNQSEEASYKRSAYRQNIVNSNNTHMNGNGQPSINGVGSNSTNGLRGKSYEPSPPPPAPSSAGPAAMEYSVNGSNNRPTVPQRRRAIEKKLGEQSSNLIHAHAPSRSASGLVPSSSVSQLEPPPDYSPPPRSRSRSSSPQVDYLMTRPPPPPSSSREMPPSSTMTLSRKQQQRTRFAPTSSYPPVSSTGTLRPGNGTTSASTSNLSALSGSKPSRMGQVIGNSLRKLVSKIRSASAERKFRMKSASNKSREQSPSPGTAGNPIGVDGNGMTTYQQYNVIDGHIGGGGTRHHSSNDSEDSTSDNQRRRGERERADRVERQPLKPESQSSGRLNFKRAESADPQLQLSPRQRYYLGEDPYSSSLYGKENIYERRPRQRYDQNREHGEQRDDDYYETSRGPAPPPPPPVTSSHTLGRYQKHGQRFSGSTPNLNLHQDYRSAQTLPRKLHEQRKQPLAAPPTNRVMNGMNTTNYVQSSGNPGSAAGPVSIQTGPRSIGSGVVPSIPPGPAKPARTYAKVLNRSKSFNVHGMNGGNDPSPIYIEKLTRNNYPSNGYQISGGSSRPEPAPGLAQSSAYKSQPHLFSSGKDNSLKSGLKSPSIVNLISRSQKDLTKISGNDDEQDDLSLSYHHPHETESKKQLYLRGLHQQAPDLYRVLHGHEEDQHHQQYGRSPAPGPPTKYPLQPKYSLDSRSAAPTVELNKDTASIVRRSSEVDSKRLIYADEPVVHHHHHQQQQHHHHHPHVQHHLQHSQHQHQQQQQHLPHHQHLRRGSGATIIELRNRK